MSETVAVVVQTCAGQRKTYTFDSADEAKAFVVKCKDTVIGVHVPARRAELEE